MQEMVLQTGQVWADNDPRAEGRTLRIEAFDYTDSGEMIALCTVLTMPYTVRKQIEAGQFRKDNRGSIVRIRIRRFQPRSAGGYVLVEEEAHARA